MVQVLVNVVGLEFYALVAERSPYVTVDARTQEKGRVEKVTK